MFGLDESDSGKDLVGRGGPDKRFSVAVPMGDVVLDPLEATAPAPSRPLPHRTRTELYKVQRRDRCSGIIREYQQVA